MKLEYDISIMSIKVIHCSQFDEMGQGFHETTERDRAIGNNLQEILVSIDRSAGTIKNAIEGFFWVRFIPHLNFAEEILIKRPSLPWRRCR